MSAYRSVHNCVTPLAHISVQNRCSRKTTVPRFSRIKRCVFGQYLVEICLKVEGRLRQYRFFFYFSIKLSSEKGITQDDKHSGNTGPIKRSAVVAATWPSAALVII